ncbi:MULTISPECIES: helix-turn-helix domain-containing protein [unclassified Pseudoalteromonas]
MGVHDIEPLWQVEKRAIESAIAVCDDNIPLAAAYLGVSASTIYRKIKGWS